MSLAHATQNEIFENQEDFESIEDVYAAMQELPEKLVVYRYDIPDGYPLGYDESKFGGPWCQKGASIFALKVPSLNRTNTNK